MTIWLALVALGCTYALVAVVAFAFNIIYVVVLYLLRFRRSRPDSLKADDFVEQFIEYLETDWWYRTVRSVYALPLRVLTSCMFPILSGVLKILIIVKYLRTPAIVRARYLRRKRAQQARKNATN